MNKLKFSYEQPCSETLVVRLEGAMICGSPDGYHPGGGGSYGDDDTNENGDY